MILFDSISIYLSKLHYLFISLKFGSRNNTWKHAEICIGVYEHGNEVGELGSDLLDEVA